jgi:hypothetical protein
MCNKICLSLAAALGLATLVATAFAQVGTDHHSPILTQGQLFKDDVLLPSNKAAGTFTFYGKDHLALTSEEARLSMEADQLARQIGQAKTDDDKEKLKAKFTVVLDKQFDQRQRRHESEIQSLEAQVKKLKELVRLRNDKRREIVAQRLEQVLRDAQGLGW